MPARTRAEAAFVKEMTKIGGRLHLHIDEDNGGKFLDVARDRFQRQIECASLLLRAIADAGSLREATEALPRERVHVEYFSSPEAPATEGGFTVVLVRSGREIPIPAGITILEALRQGGVKVPSACEQGVCGTCRNQGDFGTARSPGHFANAGRESDQQNR